MAFIEAAVTRVLGEGSIGFGLDMFVCFVDFENAEKELIGLNCWCYSRRLA